MIINDGIAFIQAGGSSVQWSSGRSHDRDFVCSTQGPRTLPTKSFRGILLMVSEKPTACRFPGSVSTMLAT